MCFEGRIQSMWRRVLLVIGLSVDWVIGLNVAAVEGRWRRFLRLLDSPSCTSKSMFRVIGPFQRISLRCNARIR
jgi:hypothetical protein